MTLLWEVIESHGGAELWRQLRRFCARVSINGALLADKGKADALKDVVVDGSTRDQFLRFTGFSAPDRRATYRPDRVTVESLDGRVLAERNEPRAAFAGHTDSTAWDDLHLAYFVGYSNWNYFTTPFLLSGEGFVSEELSPWREDGQTWRRLKVTFPSRIATHSPVQTFYFDRQGLQRCVQYRAIAGCGAMLCDYTWAQEEFSGIIVPTQVTALDQSQLCAEFVDHEKQADLSRYRPRSQEPTSTSQLELMPTSISTGSENKLIGATSSGNF